MNKKEMPVMDTIIRDPDDNEIRMIGFSDRDIRGKYEQH